MQCRKVNSSQEKYINDGGLINGGFFILLNTIFWKIIRWKFFIGEWDINWFRRKQPINEFNALSILVYNGYILKIKIIL